MSTTAKQISLVQQMLKKAETTTPAEAEMIMARVDRMMAKLNIDETMLNAKSAEKSVHVKKEIRIQSTHAAGEVLAAAAVINAFGNCYLLQSKRSAKDTTLLVYGRESAVDWAIMIAESLLEQGRQACATWWKTAANDCYQFETAHTKWAARRQFLISFGYGAADRIRSEQRKAVQETPGSELVLLDEKVAAEDFARRMAGATKNTRGLNAGSYLAAYAGRAAGRTANVGTTSVNGGSRDALGG